MEACDRGYDSHELTQGAKNYLLSSIAPPQEATEITLKRLEQAILRGTDVESEITIKKRNRPVNHKATERPPLYNPYSIKEEETEGEVPPGYDMVFSSKSDEAIRKQLGSSGDPFLAAESAERRAPLNPELYPSTEPRGESAFAFGDEFPEFDEVAGAEKAMRKKLKKEARRAERAARPRGEVYLDGVFVPRAPNTPQMQNVIQTQATPVAAAGF